MRFGHTFPGSDEFEKHNEGKSPQWLYLNDPKRPLPVKVAHPKDKAHRSERHWHLKECHSWAKNAVEMQTFFSL